MSRAFAELMVSFWRGVREQERRLSGQEAELRRVAAEQQHPRLWVGHVCPGRWEWVLTAPDGSQLDDGQAETRGEALAVGLAALEVASLAGSRS